MFNIFSHPVRLHDPAYCLFENISLILLARSLIENLGINLLARSLIGKYLPYSARSLAQWRKLAFSTQKNVNPIFFDQMAF